MTPNLQKKLEQIFKDAAAKRSWGEVTIVLKEGKPGLLRIMIQEKVEEYPAYGSK